ncbi:hypothetical protein O1611_g752 [Lasiodiplodia mahajangana]|uniref:Uncharacterized protein n=1 Tax=Lasiodiplodia mahajangana TaxID=1108764 RepID=A0ACC2JZB3_9PEZI|nr:hypothetical protein O1611_g752 [Lasiodiplodia mahajangana]
MFLVDVLYYEPKLPLPLNPSVAPDTSMHIDHLHVATENVNSDHHRYTTNTTRVKPNAAAMPKWDDKSERDMLLAMRIAENGYAPFTQENSKKAARVMTMMGYPEVTWGSVSQRWSKVIQRNFQKKYLKALEAADGTAADGTAADGTTTSGTAAPVRRGAKRPPKRKPEQEEKGNVDEDDEDDIEQLPIIKKRK